MQRFSILLPLLCALAELAGCDSDDVCSCPTSDPSVRVPLACGESTATLQVSGVCANTETTTAGGFVFSSESPGACEVTLQANGVSYAATVDFTGEWLACGSDPHGCGQLISAAGAASRGILELGPSCDAGGATTADAH